MVRLVKTGVVALAGLAVASAQQAGTVSEEDGPSVTLRECTKKRGCRSRTTTATLDANWRWLHEASGYRNCYTSTNEWDPTFCPDPATCAQNCALEGVTAEQYSKTYGINSSAGGLELKFATTMVYGANYGSRVYLLQGSKYKQFKLLNREFALDVDVSKLPCGLNGAVYFVEMDRKGGGSQAGAKFGTGYCDAQCPHDVKYIEGEVNMLDWRGKEGTPLGRYGSCCAEMDIWEANSRAAAFTPHPCKLKGPRRCEDTDCGDGEERYDGICDKDGCDWNDGRLRNEDFYGPGPSYAVDTTRPFTVVTQFLTDDGTDDGDLVEIRRFYVQDGHVVPNSNATILGSEAGDSVTDSFCSAQKSAFDDLDDTAAKGGLRQMGKALGRGMTLVLSLWDDSAVNMLWLDSKYPATADPATPGVVRGPCPGGESSTPAYIRQHFADASVKFTNLAVGEIGSTVKAGRHLRAQYV